MHLADAFIQSDLHCIQVTVFYIWSALAFPGNRTHDLGVASAILYYLSYRKAVSKESYPRKHAFTAHLTWIWFGLFCQICGETSPSTCGQIVWLLLVCFCLPAWHVSCHWQTHLWILHPWGTDQQPQTAESQFQKAESLFSDLKQRNYKYSLWLEGHLLRYKGQ